MKLSDEQLELIATIASNIGVESYKEERKAAEKRRKAEHKKETKEMLVNYRRLKKQINDERVFTEEEKSEIRWKFIEDLMGSSRDIVTKSERVINEKERIRQENLYAIYRIDNALKMYKEECMAGGNDEEKRRYRAIDMMYISDEPKTVEEISSLEKVSDKTVYRDLGIATEILTIYLFGVSV